MAVPSGTGRRWQRQDIKQADYKPFGTLPPFVLQSEGTQDISWVYGLTAVMTEEEGESCL